MSRYGLLLLLGWLAMLQGYQVVHCAPTMRLDGINHPPSVSSYNLSDGSIVDCVKIRDQPTLQDPSFKDHVIKEPPSMLKNFKTSAHLEAGNNLVQLFHVEGQPCPHGTIPIQRVTKAHMEESARLHEHKRASRFGRNAKLERNVSSFIPTATGTIMSAYAVLDGVYHGGFCRISAWSPICKDVGDLSYTQMTLISEDDDILKGRERLNTAEVGWITSYGVGQPHLYTYWTGDNYQHTGCRNLECAGFIQTDGKYVLGNPILTGDGSSALYQIAKGGQNEDWWLLIEDTWVGYWPASLYKGGLLKDSYTSRIVWGGEISTTTNPPHVQMGNGRFGSTGPDHAVGSETDVPAHHALLSYLLARTTYSLDAQPPGNNVIEGFEADKVSVQETNSNYYNTKVINHQASVPGIAGGTWLFYGGYGAGV